MSISFIFHLLSIVDVGETFNRFRDIKTGYNFAALVLLITSVALSVLKSKLILLADDIQTPYPLLLKAYYIGNFRSLFLPSSFGGDIYRVYAVSSRVKGLGKIIFLVLFDRLTEPFALRTIALLAYVLFGRGPYGGALVALNTAGLASLFC